LILRSAIVQGTRRYNEWYRRLDITNSVLTKRLTFLTEQGVFEKRRYQERPIRYEYELTPAGRALWRVLLTLWAWERSYAEHEEQIEQMRHRPCGQSLSVALTCASCHLESMLRDVKGTVGPAGGDERSVPRETTRRRTTAIDRGPGLYPETMALIGNRWSATLLSSAFQGDRRFTDFEQRMGAPPTMVADRLRLFCELGVLETSVMLQGYGRNDYRLTEKGRAFFPVVMVSIAWGQRWFPDPEGPAMLLEHAPCGSLFVPRLACRECHEEIRSDDVIIDVVAINGA
jgi:DNA-binding HxlR family transcriptional regulator